MENEINLVVDALPGLIWTALPGGGIDFVNQRWCEYTGLGSADCYAEGWEIAIHPEDRAALVEGWRSIVASGKPGELEARMRRSDGTYRWFLVRANPVTDASGQVIKWYGVSTDIEDNTSLGEPDNLYRRLSSRHRDDYFRSIIDGLPTMVTLMTPEGYLDHANRNTLEYFGITLEQAKAQETAATIHPDDRNDALKVWMRSMETGERFEFEGRQRRADGMYRWFDIRGFPLRDSAGRVVLWYVLQSDIDARKQAEALLAGEKRLLEMVARGVSLPIILDALCRLAEATISGCSCGILLLDSGGTKFVHGAAPGLPSSYNDALNGRLVDRHDGPCGMAASLKAPVIMSDAASDPRWSASEWRNLALANGLRSCWSTPILSADQTVLGVFNLYRHEPLSPSQVHQERIEQFTHITSIAIDRAMNDSALRHGEARKTAIMASALDCIVTIDHNGCVTEFNPAAEQIFGYRRDDAMGRHLADIIIPPSLRERHRKGFARYLATGEAVALGKRLELTAMRADGSEFPVELAIVRIPFDGLPSFTGYLRDITDRKRSEESLRRSEAYLAEAQRLSLTGSFGWKVSADEHFWSSQTFRIFEYDTSTRITLQMVLQRIHPQDIELVEQTIVLAATEVQDFDFECRLLMPEGAVKHIHIVAHGALNQDGGIEYTGAVQDVTERFLSEQALSEVRSELAHISRITSLGALTASIAHEVNQPLSGIITNANTCLRMLAADPPNVAGAQETARRTIRDGNRAADVITRLRALYTKKEAASEAVDLNEATREVIALSLSELQRSQVIVRADLAVDLPLVTGDRVQLQQVILNLLLNAKDAMNGVDDRPRQLVIHTEQDGSDCVFLAVQDTGMGIDPQSTGRLFQPFYSTKSGGMGIGLSVCRSIIESHRGRLMAAPNVGPGATFWFSIPCGPDGTTEVRGSHAVWTPAKADSKHVVIHP